MKYHMRKKGKWKQGSSRYILEKSDEGKIVETKTVPRPKALWEMLRLAVNSENPSPTDAQKVLKSIQKVAHPPLTEPKKQDVLPEITEEQKRLLYEASK